MQTKGISGFTRAEEEKNLSDIIEIAQENLDNAKEGIRQMDADVADLFESIDMRDKEALILWNDATIRLKEMKRVIDRFEKARKKPYFGRITFEDPTVEGTESYYIGRVGIAKDSADPVVIDWRAPIASVYYENNLGPCQYTVSSEGTFEIDLKGKRTYEIENDRLKDYFDSDVVANDELLTKYLAKNKKAVLGEIIATIQKEQNLIIRRSPKTNIIVQGCAGSGKTTVAMHRISYILYNYEEDFRPEDFYIIGSNKILLNYITSVLPDLDVYGISQMTMEELFTRLLYEDWDKEKYEIKALDKNSEVDCEKGKKEWFKALEEFCWNYECGVIKRENICLEKTGELLIGENLIENYCKDNPKMSMQQKCLMLNEILMSKYENLVQGKNVSFSAQEKKEMEKKYSTYFGRKDWKGSIFELYNEFLTFQGWETFDFKSTSGKKTQYDVYDLAALAYIYKRIKEIDPIREASHVVIDEAQDFGMMAYCCMHYCLRNCTYTIMGDTSQNIHFGYGLNDWEDLRKLVLTGTYDAFGLLKKSYRNTVEISNYATDILRHGDFAIYPVEPIIRHGDEVQIETGVDTNQLLAMTLCKIKEWISKDYDTIAIVCRDEQQTKEVAEELGKYLDIIDGTSPDAEFGNGIMVLPVAYTKGLEFDAVILFDPSQEKYPENDNYVKLLYVAATRALHDLVIFHKGDATGLLTKPVPEGKKQKEISAETLTKALEYEKVTLTQKEVEEQLRREGAVEMAERNYIGPKRVVIKSQGNTDDTYVVNPQNAREKLTGVAYSVREKSTSVAYNAQRKSTSVALSPERGTTVKNNSPFKFGDLPVDSELRPKGHGKIDTAVKWVKKDKKQVGISSSYGILRVMPISENMVRIFFSKGQILSKSESYWKVSPDSSLKWSAKESRSLVEIATGNYSVKVDKKTGVLGFYDRSGKLLVEERDKNPRQIDGTENWTYFNWDKNEKLKAKGILKDDFTDIRNKARYISFGGKNLRMPFVVSDKNYGIAVAGEQGVLFCGLNSFGPYIKADGMKQIEYYLITADSRDGLVEIYNQLNNL